LASPAPQFLYLSTLGWKTGRQHRIEIWFVEYRGNYYVLSERRRSAHWVQNILHSPAVSFSVAGKDMAGRARVVSKDEAVATEVARLMKEKYGWSDGLIVELAPGRQ
jgi:hypothetical protein